MSHKKPHVGVVGFEIWVETKLDLAAATDIKMRFQKPDLTTAEFTAISDNRSGPRSTTRYGASFVTASASDLDQAGDWLVQVVATGVAGFSGPGSIAELEVGAAI